MNARLAALPVAQAQGVLALHLAAAPDFPTRPNLRLVSGVERELDTFVTRFSQALVEVVAGDRGVQQLIRWTTDDVYLGLQRRTGLLRSSDRGQQIRPRLRAQVRSVHLQRPSSDVAEVSIHVRHGQRSRAIAARIELLEGRWRCSALQFG